MRLMKESGTNGRSMHEEAAATVDVPPLSADLALLGFAPGAEVPPELFAAYASASAQQSTCVPRRRAGVRRLVPGQGAAHAAS